MSTISTCYVGRRELLRELGISKTTILRWTAERGFPEPLTRSGRVPIYDRAKIDAWLLGSTTEEAR